ncbi:streptogrisin C [Saccharothrix tamanrassetensis]|uniref:Streptogrisin C n=1 Tax=Saccharothrix tamanrassetensis TaxID=1051531 RepID=A0A841CEM9_9PSEU|nr:S1 family peptidase [Saccharothrix tamanrassetensis]MBB5955440.1 streptogrisin C [Saccharothrix tamanrassetensis]
MRTLLVVLLLLVATATPAAAAIPLEAGTPLNQSAGARCVNGFNTAGHLLVSVACARANPTLPGIGPVVAIRATYAVVRLSDPDKWDQLPRVAGHPTAVTGSLEGTVGSSVCGISRVGGTRCGVIQAKNASITFPGGTVTGLTRTSLCVHPGEDWVPVVAGGQAQGHLIGGSGSGSCSSYFYPLSRILAAERLTLVTA